MADVDVLHDVACQELAEVCGVVNAGHGRMVRLMVDVLDSNAWSGAGILSPHQWLTWRTSLSRPAASAVLNLAKRADELVATVTALSEGRISLESAGLIARYVPAEYEQCALGFASIMTVAQLRRSVSRYHFDLENPEPPAPDAGAPPGSEAAADASPHDVDGGDDPARGPEPDGAPVPDADGAAHDADTDAGADSGGPSGASGMIGGRLVGSLGRPIEERVELNMGYDDHGNWSASIHLPADLAAVFEAAVRTRREDLYRLAENGLAPTDPRPRVTLVDALLSLVEGALAEGAAAMPGTDRYLVHAHLTGAPDGGNALQLHLGATLPAHLRRLYTCDGTIRPVLERDGVPVNVGRLQRIVSRRVRRLIEHRDGGCAVPGCGQRHRLEVHHIWHWEDGGLTTTDNLLTLCRLHHRQHHLGHLRIWGNADGSRYTGQGVQFADASGRLLTPVGVPVPVDGDLMSTARRRGLEPAGFEAALGERLDHSAVLFNRNGDRDRRQDDAAAAHTDRPPPSPPGGCESDRGEPLRWFGKVTGSAATAPPAAVPDMDPELAEIARFRDEVLDAWQQESIQRFSDIVCGLVEPDPEDPTWFELLGQGGCRPHLDRRVRETALSLRELALQPA